MNTPSYTDRVAWHLARYRSKKRPARTRRALLVEVARLATVLDARDDAYRRLLSCNSQLEADRRFAEAIGAAITAGCTLADLGAVAFDRYTELELDHATAEALR